MTRTNMRVTRFEALYEQCYPQILAYCLRRVVADEASAAANDTFAVAWRRFDEMPDRAYPLPWLYGVARRVLAGQRRTNRRYGNLLRIFRQHPVIPVQTPETVVVARVEFERVLEALSKLRSSDQEILRLAAWEGVSHKEIGGILGISISAVDQRFHRAKQRLAEKFEALELKEHGGHIEGGIGS